MEKQDPFFELITDIITSSIQTICFLSPLAVFIAIVLWGIIAVMALNSRPAMKFFIIWISISTVVCGVILFVTKTMPLIIPPIYILVMLQSVIATVCYSKALRHSPKE